MATPGLGRPLPDADLMPEELRAAIVLFASLLDERQRRLFAGLESLKCGWGGDRRIATLLGIDPSTVATGRRQLVERDAPHLVARAGPHYRQEDLMNPPDSGSPAVTATTILRTLHPVLNHPVPPAFRESVKVGEQNLYARAKELIGDRDPRAHEYTIQLRPFDADTSGAGLGLPVLVACVGGLLERSTRGW